MGDNTEKGQEQMSNDPLLVQDGSTNEAKPQKGIMSLIRSHKMRGHESKERVPLLAYCQASFCMAKPLVD